MAHILTAIGEEYAVKNGLDSGATAWNIGLYNDASGAATGGDAIADTDDLIAITTEPANTNYARQGDTFTPSGSAGAWGSDNDTQIQFDFSDQSTSEMVDSWFVVINFDSAEAGDAGTAADHLVVTGPLSQARDIGSIDTLTIDAGGVRLDLE